MNFNDFKKEAENIFGHAMDTAVQNSFDLMAEASSLGQPNDSALTDEAYFENEQRELQTQAHLNTDLVQTAQHFENFPNYPSDFGGTFATQVRCEAVSQGIATMSQDFMKVERGLFGGFGDSSKDLLKGVATFPSAARVNDALSEGCSGDRLLEHMTSSEAGPGDNVEAIPLDQSSACKKAADDDLLANLDKPPKVHAQSDASNESQNENSVSSDDINDVCEQQRADASVEKNDLMADAGDTTAPLQLNEDKRVDQSKITTCAVAAAAKETLHVGEASTAAATFNVTETQSFVGAEQTNNILSAWLKPNGLPPTLESLIYWRDVKKSSIIFCAGLSILLAISCFSVFSVVAYISLFLLTGTLAIRINRSIMNALQLTSYQSVFNDYIGFDWVLPKETVQNMAAAAATHVNNSTAVLRRLFLVEDLVDSIKFGVILWILTYIGAWFNGITLITLGYITLFTFPKVYEKKKQTIDSYVVKLVVVSDTIKAAIPIVARKPLVAEAKKNN